MITIGIIEDDWALRQSISDYISRYNDLQLLFSCNCIEKWLVHLEADPEVPKMVFLDIGLPGISGLKAISIIKKDYPETILIIITGDSSIESIWDAILNGANGYLLKPFSLLQLREQIDIIEAGGAALSPNIAEKLIRNINQKNNNPATIHLLTSRQNDVLELLIKGLTYKEISNILNVSTATVNDHIKKIYIKMCVNSKSELICKVLNNKLFAGDGIFLHN